MVIEIKTDKPYEVIVEDGVLDRAGEKIVPLVRPGSRAMIVSETNVFPIYGERLKASLEKAGIHTAEFVFEAGEPQKQLSTVMQIYEALAENDFTRSDIIVTLGGGVAGDMGGFAAATFLRGIDFVQVPTSLLAQVDASVGGKTGVDLPFGKNLVGAFHQPRLVLADPKTLSTLPDAYFTDTWARSSNTAASQTPRCSINWSRDKSSTIWRKPSAAACCAKSTLSRKTRTTKAGV